MKKRTFAIALIITLAVSLLLVVGLNAGTKAKDEFQMNASYEHTKSLPTFAHKKHITEYKLTCGECHHNDKGEPLNTLKEGDNVQKCIECHKKPGEIKGKEAKGLSKKEKRAYHANAVHENCKGCHRKYNKENKTKAAPTKCTGCHPKKKQ